MEARAGIEKLLDSKLVSKKLVETACLGAWGLVAMAGLSGCASHFERSVVRLGYDSQVVTGSPFRHRILEVTRDQNRMNERVIVLLDGDGHAFLDRTTVARDPTPTRSWLLDAGADLRSFGDVIYLGRPCYHLPESDPACHPKYWTLARYGDAVVGSLAATLRRYLSEDQEAVLVGYSGGGVLALLLAGELPDVVRGVVTVGAPLDLTGWARYHGYSPLTASRDPADQPSRYRSLCRRHLFGARDTIVPPDLVDGWRWPSQPMTAVQADHTCCWKAAVRAAVATVVVGC